ncbi:MAG: PqqD family protein [Chloroflexi bacterium]|nr:PqqD family protein [Chloroflexota bacterium]
MKRNDNIVLRNIGDTYILIPLVSGNISNRDMIILNETGCYIWEQLEEEYHLDELIVKVATHFGVNLENVIDDVTLFVNNLESLGLLKS